MTRSRWPRLRRYGLELGLLALGLVGVHAYHTRTNARGAAPEVSMRTLDGDSVTLGSGQGEPQIIHFWATWCGVCEAEESNIADVAKTGRLITIASRSGSPTEVAATMRARGLSFPVIADTGGSVASLYGVRAFPTTFFVDREGMITTSEVGYTTYFGLRARLWWAGL